MLHYCTSIYIYRQLTWHLVLLSLNKKDNFYHLNILSVKQNDLLMFRFQNVYKSSWKCDASVHIMNTKMCKYEQCENRNIILFKIMHYIFGILLSKIGHEFTYCPPKMRKVYIRFCNRLLSPVKSLTTYF